MSERSPASERSRVTEFLGRTISGRYKIESLIAAGGMGAVFRGEHLKMRKRVAIKILHAELEGLIVLKEQFEREAIAGAHISHANVASATDFGELDDGSYFLILEYLRGETLAKVLKSGPLSVERAVNIAKQIAAGLEAVHEMEIVHRDVKAENIMLIEGTDDLAKVIDFGFAKVKMDRVSVAGADDPLHHTEVDSDTVFGTIGYLAPEAMGGLDALDHRSDLYALGVIMYEMLVGSRPFEADKSAEVFRMHREDPPPPFIERAPMVPIPGPIEGIVMRLLAKDPADRFQRASEVADALDRAGAGKAKSLSMPPSQVDLPKNIDDILARRSPYRGLWFLLLMLAGFGAAVWFMPNVREQLRAWGIPIPDNWGADEGGKKEVDGKGAAAWTARLLAAPAAKDWDAGIEALAALAELDPTALGTDEVAAAAERVAVASLTHKPAPSKVAPSNVAPSKVAPSNVAPSKVAPKTGRSDAGAVAADAGSDAGTGTSKAGAQVDVFVLLATRFGSDGPELLYRIAQAHPKTHAAHKRAYGELRQPDAVALATPALRIAVELADAPCEKKALLFRRAQKEGDARALKLLRPLKHSPCRSPMHPCCFRNNTALDRAIEALQGHATAQFNLAVMYYNGEGVPQDLVLAHMWINIAGTNGNETSRNARDILEPDMTPAEIRRATDLARTCMASDYRNCEP